MRIASRVQARGGCDKGTFSVCLSHRNRPVYIQPECRRWIKRTATENYSSDRDRYRQHRDDDKSSDNHAFTLKSQSELQEGPQGDNCDDETTKCKGADLDTGYHGTDDQRCCGQHGGFTAAGRCCRPPQKQTSQYRGGRSHEHVGLECRQHWTKSSKPYKADTRTYQERRKEGAFKRSFCALRNIPNRIQKKYTSQNHKKSVEDVIYGSPPKSSAKHGGKKVM